MSTIAGLLLSVPFEVWTAAVAPSRTVEYLWLRRWFILDEVALLSACFVIATLTTPWVTFVACVVLAMAWMGSQSYDD